MFSRAVLILLAMLSVGYAPTWSGGTNDVVTNSTFGFLTVQGGSNRIWDDGGSGFGPAALTINGAGSSLTFDGSAGGILKVAGDQVSSNAGIVILNTNLTYSGSIAAAGILDQVAQNADGNDLASFGAAPGRLSFGGATRTFTIANGVPDVLQASSTIRYTTDLQVTTALSNGGLVKAGPGQLLISNGAGLTGGIAVNDGLLSVGGSLDGSLTLGSGGGLSPGVVTSIASSNGTNNVHVGTDGIGLLATGGKTLTLQPNSRLVFQFRDSSLSSAAQGAAGTSWDLVNLGGGTINLNATSAQPVILTLEAFTTQTQLGHAATFDPSADGEYFWLFASNVQSVSLTGGDLLNQRFQVDDAGVFNSVTGFAKRSGSSFSVVQMGDGLFLKYASIPEPAEVRLFVAAALCLAQFRHRKRATLMGSSVT